MSIFASILTRFTPFVFFFSFSFTNLTIDEIIEQTNLPNVLWYNLLSYGRKEENGNRHLEKENITNEVLLIYSDIQIIEYSTLAFVGNNTPR